MKISAHFVPQVLFPHSTGPVDNFPAKKPPGFWGRFFSKVFAASMMPHQGLRFYRTWCAVQISFACLRLSDERLRMQERYRAPEVTTTSYPGSPLKFFCMPSSFWRKTSDAETIPGAGRNDYSMSPFAIKVLFAYFFFQEKVGQREELMLAVMSRTLFCMLVSPFFRATSTFRMA